MKHDEDSNVIIPTRTDDEHIMAGDLAFPLRRVDPNLLPLILAIVFLLLVSGFGCGCGHL
jgi:hypothetical protein